MNRDQRREGVESGMHETEAKKPESPEKKITDAGRQRLETIGSGWKAFKAGLRDRLGGLARGAREAGINAIIGALSAPEAGAAAGKAIGRTGAETGRAIGRTAEKGGRAIKGGVEATGRGIRTGAEVGVGAVALGGMLAVEGARAGINKVREKASEGKDAVVDGALELYDRGAALHDRFQDKVAMVQESFHSKMTAIRESITRRKEMKEYSKLLAKKEEMTPKLARLAELETKFGGSGAEA